MDFLSYKRISELKKMKHQQNSKTAKILRWMGQGNTLNTIQGFTMFDTPRLGGIIFSLRKQGYRIAAKYSDDRRIAIYSINGKKKR